MLQEFGQMLIKEFLGLVFTLIGAVVVKVLLPELVNLIKSKTNNQKLNSAIDDMSNCVATAVDCVNQTFVSNLKAEGKFDDEAKLEAMNKAIDKAIHLLSDGTKDFFSSQNSTLEDILLQYIEAYIYNSKN